MLQDYYTTTYNDLIAKLDFNKLRVLYNEVSNHLDLLNQKQTIENNVDNQNIINLALENIIFITNKPIIL